MEFDELYNKHYQQVRKTVAKYLKTEEDIDDVTQDVFITAYVELDSFNGDSNVSTWLTKIAMNKSINFIRRAKLANSTFVGVVTDEMSLDNPEHIVSVEESLNEVAKYLSSLPKERILVITARELEGKSYKEISESYNVPQNTAKTWVKRYKEKVKTLISP